MITKLINDVTAASTDSPLLPERSKRRDRNPKELTEPRLPIRVAECCARLAEKEARGVRGREERVCTSFFLRASSQFRSLSSGMSCWSMECPGASSGTREVALTVTLL